MPEDIKKPNDSASDSNNGSADSGGAADSSTATATMDGNADPINASTNTAEAQGSEQAQSLALGKKQEVETIKDISPLEKVKQAVLEFAASFNLKPELLAQVEHGITGPAMAGISLTGNMVEQVVKNVAPIEYAMVKFKEAVGNVFTHVDNGISQVPSQAQGRAQERGMASSF